VIVEDQTPVVKFLSRPDTYGIRDEVERIDTHIASVFLAGDRAYKLKRAVRFPYLDLSTVARRRAMCEAEVEINRRTAPDLYLGVEAVTSADGKFRLGGPGDAVDWVVVMKRFDQSGLLDRVATRGALDARLVRRLAAAIARFHRESQASTDHGGVAETNRVIDGIAESFEAVAQAFSADQVMGVIGGLRREASRHAGLLDARRDAGFVRHCHGDLHLRNIVLIDDRPVLFDAIEFSDELAIIDVLYDIAFLIMDLEHRGLRTQSNTLLNGYLLRNGGYEGLALLPLFLAMRAAIRAHVTASAAQSQADPAVVATLGQEAVAYLDLASKMLAGRSPALVAVGGLSGTGKTTLAYGLAPLLGRPPGAVVLRSDEIRKEIMGVDPYQRLPEDAYRDEVSRKVYDLLHERSKAVLECGQAAVCDAVYNRPDGRAAVEQVAAGCRVPFVGIWLEASPETLMERVGGRTGDASDATADVVRLQLQTDTGPIRWSRVDASGTSEDVCLRVLSLLDAVLDTN
jgi:aminoglycoside phosphotransferase family enzyme/predicted kinase